MKTYSLYDILTVMIEDEVSSSVAKSIDFQLNHFEMESSQSSLSADYEIIVRAYNKFKRENYPGLVYNYNYTGKWNECCIDDAAKLAIVKTLKGFDIYCTQPNFLITVFIQILLLNKGIYFVHSAGIVNKNQEAVLLTGAGGVGKTASINGFIENHGYRLLGDDIIALQSSGECLPFPRSFVIKEYHKNVYPGIFKDYRKSPFQKMMTSIKEFIRLNAPFREVIRNYLIKKGIKDNVMAGWHREPYVAAVPVSSIFGKDAVSSSARGAMIIDLVRYPGDKFEFVPIEKSEIQSRLKSVIGFEWHNSFMPVIIMGLFGMFNMEEYIVKTSEISGMFLREIKTFRLYIPEKSSPDVLSEYLKDIVLNLKSGK